VTFPFVRVLGLAALAAAISAGRARADLVFTLEESGPDVVLSVSGSIDTSKLTPYSQWFSESVGAINPTEGQIILGVGFDLGNRYVLVKGADVFGGGAPRPPAASPATRSIFMGRMSSSGSLPDMSRAPRSRRR
jgi:hypothetical protein